MKQHEIPEDISTDKTATHDDLSSVKPLLKDDVPTVSKDSADKKRDLLDEIMEEHKDAWAELAKL